MARLVEHGCAVVGVDSSEGMVSAAVRRRGLEVESPWYFPRPGQYRRLLAACGFEVLQVELFDRPTPLPGDLRDWLETMPQPYTQAVPQAERRSFIDEVVERLRPLLCDAAGRWTADYVRLRFAAAKPPPRGA